MTFKPAVLFSLALLVILGSSGCNWSPSTAAPAPTAPASTVQGAAEDQNVTRVAKVVFVGKRIACECTRKAIDAGWAALHQALGTDAPLPVTHIQMDTEEARVEWYRKQKPILALPALYFLSDQNVVVEMLQGPVTVDQIWEVVGAPMVGYLKIPHKG